ncbi:MAG: MaoC family dehydratase [Chloroflexota bacterium]|nr:MaoC family dehydratase [Chloroflexota bacterium]|tara:strand:+ start:52 stop:459 length:408 start_codon:yes stop_codon:yes gene_type:complete
MELKVGQRATRSQTRTLDNVKTYAEITGDYNPLHFDEGSAGKTKFKELVMQGGLTSGILNALVAMDMLGPGIVFMSQDRKFIAPVFIGDTITAEAEVLEVHATKPVTKLKITITRQTRETVLEGEAWCYPFTPED